MFANKKAPVVFSTLCFLTVLVLCLTASPVRAGFDVMGTGVLEDEDIFYGNAQNETFRRAIESEEPLDVEDRSFLSSVHQKRVENRWYLKVRLARPSVELEDVVNRVDSSTLVLTKTSEEKDLFQFTTAFGYRWLKWAVELELLLSESLDYNVNPLFTTTPPSIQLQTDVKMFAFFGNVEYRIPNFFEILPKKLHFYLTGGLGIGFKTQDSKTLDLTGVPSMMDSNHNTDLVWNLGVGGRYQITGNLLLDLAYRLIDLGSASIGPIDGQSLRGDIKSTGLHFGVVYQI